MSAVPLQPIFYHQDLLQEAERAIQSSLSESGLIILPPMDAQRSLRLMAMLGLRAQTTMLDPWYNKGVGGVRNDYQEHILDLLNGAAPISDHIYLWGFPEIVARFVERIPSPLGLVAWLTWYYKNNPSVIRGWRSAQMACLHLSRPGAKLHPEHFLNEAQKQKQAEGKLRYMPGPPSVIEAPLNIGFVGRKEQTGHPAQKPIAVFKRLYEMTTVTGDLIFDPMSGSGTTGEAARDLGRIAVLCDQSEEFTVIMENRLGIKRIELSETLLQETNSN
jgi:site-specific DNA-methyltransferase (adenine-specific)